MEIKKNNSKKKWPIINGIIILITVAIAWKVVGTMGLYAQLFFIMFYGWIIFLPFIIMHFIAVHKGFSLYFEKLEKQERMILFLNLFSPIVTVALFAGSNNMSTTSNILNFLILFFIIITICFDVLLLKGYMMISADNKKPSIDASVNEKNIDSADKNKIIIVSAFYICVLGGLFLLLTMSPLLFLWIITVCMLLILFKFKFKQNLFVAFHLNKLLKIVLAIVVLKMMTFLIFFMVLSFVWWMGSFLLGILLLIVFMDAVQGKPNIVSSLEKSENSSEINLE